MTGDNKNIPDRQHDLRKEFSGAVRKYSEPLYWTIRRIVISHDDANDVLQNVFLKAWDRLDDFREQSKISTWLYRIAINEALDFMRRKKNGLSIDGEEELNLASRLMADAYFDGDETEAQLQEAIASLPDVQRTVFNLRYFDEMKYADISKLLHTSEGALKASYHLAVKKITEYFKHHD